MTRKILYLIVLALLTVLIWIYRSSNLEFNNTVLILTKHNYLKKTLLEPLSTTCHQPTLIIIIVTSYVGHVELRSAHRRAMPSDYLSSKNVTRIFLIAKIPENERYIKQEAINDESNIFGDLLQGSFYENYRNLTYKHLMGLKWASTECHKASYILKVDDDTVFNFDKTYEFLKILPTTEHNLLMGYMLNDTIPRRNEQNKWYVTWEEYPRSIYPSYLSGWYYIITPKVAAMICDEAMYHPFFWIDDIFVTGILTESLGLKLTHVPGNFWLEYYELLECCLRDMIKKSIICDFIVGPNGGRNNLIVEFNEAHNHCKKWNNCTLRLPEHELKKECVMYKERTIFSEGQAEIRHVHL